MFQDPSTVTINGVAKNLVRIRHDDYSSEYSLRGAADELRLFIRNSTYLDKKRGVVVDRHNVELVQTVFPVAPATRSVRRKAYVVVENEQGDTLVDPTKHAAGLLDFITESAIAQLMNNES